MLFVRNIVKTNNYILLYNTDEKKNVYKKCSLEGYPNF